MKNVPEIRFKGFADTWEHRKVDEVAEINPRSIVPEQFEYVDLESVLGTELVSHRTESRDTAPSRAQRLAKEGDIFLQTVRPYQQNNFLFDLPFKNFVFSTGYAQLRPKVNSSFLFAKLNEEKFVSVVLEKCTGTSYPAINSADLAQINIEIPQNTEEQAAIGTFFRIIDITITLYRHKLDLLRQIKNGYLRQMFPHGMESVPRVRFTGFLESWEACRLGDIAPLRGGFAFQSEDFQDSGIPIIRISNIQSSGNVGGEFVCYNCQEPDDKFSLHDNAVLIAMSGATTGKVAILNNPDNKKFYQNQRVGYFTDSGEADYNFISILVRSYSFTNQLKSALVAGAQPNISSKEIDSFVLYIPSCIKEQAAIGRFFRNLDNQIAVYQTKLNSLKQLRAAYSQKIFV